MSEKYVYLFSEGNATMRELLGGKGANLAEMTALGMPVPPGFTVTTEACTRYFHDNKTIASEIEAQVFAHIETLEKTAGKRFGDKNAPLLVSVRSGARASMPGMMDTILNLGLNDATVEGMAALTGNPRFAYDSYRRFIQMFSDVVMGLPKNSFERMLDEKKQQRGIQLDTELTVEDLKDIVADFKAFYREKQGKDFPQDPSQQLMEAITAVFRSWDNPRANYYRRINGIPYSWGTAVNVQMMVFGNMGDDSGTGVAFSRNPATGENKLYGEYLMNAQGEDVVAGVRTPAPIAHLQEVLPEIYDQFKSTAKALEQHYGDMQDMEFTIEQGKLYMLQTRIGKRTAAAALKIACDMVKEGLHTPKEAVTMVDAKSLDALLHPQFDADALALSTPVGRGLAASPGAASGQVVFCAEDAVNWAEHGKKVVLCRLETSPEDIEGMSHAEGVLTARGGMTSHAAVVARGMGACCVAGCSDMVIDEEAKVFQLGSNVFHEGDMISLDGTTGNIYAQAIPTVAASISGDFQTLMQWADDIRDLQVRTNADTPHDAAQAVKFGAQGIGLCRTEHMFFESSRIRCIREMIVSTTEEQRRTALEKLLPMQRSDFAGIYEAMEGRPVTIRLLDPPLHEFLPTEPEDIRALAKEMNMTPEALEEIVSRLHEFNPMLGFRGCRLAVAYPEIAEMQTRAIIEAAIQVQQQHPDWDIRPEIMIPLVGAKQELAYVKATVKRVADAIIEASGIAMTYMVGTMIEVPRAAVTADEIAQEAEFFSFGTNDLTQMTFGFSRDDAAGFLGYYYDNRLYEFDPFVHFDQDGVGKLLSLAAKLGRQTNPNLKLGVCGEHGGDPESVAFFQQAGLNYVSCSPYRVPIARLAAAQAAVRYPRKK